MFDYSHLFHLILKKGIYKLSEPIYRFQFQYNQRNERSKMLLFNKFVVTKQFSDMFIGINDHIMYLLSKSMINDDFIEYRIIIPYLFQFVGRHSLEKIYSIVPIYSGQNTNIIILNKKLSNLVYATTVYMVCHNTFFNQLIILLEKIYRNLVTSEKSHEIMAYADALDQFCNAILNILSIQEEFLLDIIKDVYTQLSITRYLYKSDNQMIQQSNNIIDQFFHNLHINDIMKLDNISIKEMQILYFKYNRNSIVSKHILMIIVFKIIAKLYFNAKSYKEKFLHLIKNMEYVQSENYIDHQEISIDFLTKY